MTDEQLLAIKGRFERATPGPWGLWDGYTEVSTKGKPVCQVERIGPDVIGNESVSIWYGLFSNSMIDSVIEGSAADMEFVSHAWEDIATLLAALTEDKAQC